MAKATKAAKATKTAATTGRASAEPDAGPGVEPDNGPDIDSGTGPGSKSSTEPSTTNGISRRRLLGTAGAAGAAGLAAGAATGAGVSRAVESPATALTTVGSSYIPFEGPRQAGIVEPGQARGHLVAFDLAPGADRRAAAALLRRWSDAVRAMTEAGRAGGPALPAGYDDQVADDAGPSSLTVTFGFGRSFFTRTGLTAQLPEALAPLPDFPSDAIDRRRSDGDLWVQIGADDALVAFHALRVIQKAARDTAEVRWQMNGFNRTPGATARPMTARNLMGQIDGTNNPKPSEPGFDAKVFVPANGSPAWMAGGSYAVVRRIRMLLDSWDHLSVARQERVIGRRKSDGAPLSGGTETTPVGLDTFLPDGSLAIPSDAHVRVAAPASNSGATMLRRPFSYHDGIGADGTPDAGLLFVAWQADPMRGFVPVQRKLDGGDGLTRFLRHETSGLYAVPGGVGPGEYVGQRLLEG
ncbi:iron uptake transporter deferrochelatase/peroxidase subunit [Actinacidiphila acididurans]|uniref:Deferrochelatase n=1 Tax=Actinacidiphila acididurans TaxID=2784346 RepID=A0ABS2TVN7_9ACTN|nr:iron uptake transporter deferrochelatase/peroxidase subunit [Actinacidiphila acididurans]MBM9506018.1 deferrochelatase/peroxidase EfeB [Actinacidiphila acididurans]